MEGSCIQCVRFTQSPIVWWMDTLQNWLLEHCAAVCHFTPYSVVPMWLSREELLLKLVFWRELCQVKKSPRYQISFAFLWLYISSNVVGFMSVYIWYDSPMIYDISNRFHCDIRFLLITPVNNKDLAKIGKIRAPLFQAKDLLAITCILKGVDLLRTSLSRCLSNTMRLGFCHSFRPIWQTSRWGKFLLKKSGLFD